MMFSFKKILLLVVVIGGAGVFWLYRGQQAHILSDKAVYYTVKSGASLSSIAADLEKKGIIASAFDFKLLARLKGNKPVQAADYQFNAGISIAELYQDLIEGKSISNERQVTLVEGLTLVQMADVLAQEGIVVSADAYVQAATVGTERFNDDFPLFSGRPAGATLEGYLFPETYRFFPNSEPDAVIRKQLTTFTDQFDEPLRKAIAASSRTFHDTIILASIVEKEVRSHEEMKTVAGIFANRLEAGMALQADSTVNYITSSGRARSTYEDLEIDSPYNTYKYAGLPKGPISNPGLNAITAAAEPMDTPYFYFLTDEAGKVYYGKTLEEHNRNRQKYL